jgi:pimeloyl-ACP methyl ester carboxylesterase
MLASMHLVLVHGSYFGSWSWSRVSPELERRGHRVTAVDLPIGDRSAGAEAYAAAVIHDVDWSDPVVLVGHSMAGLVLPVVAAQRPVERMIFVASLLPRPGMSVNEQRAMESIDPPAPASAQWTDLGDGLWMVGPDTARELFFQDLDADDAAWALERIRPQAYRVMTEITPLLAWPNVPSAYIVCRDDRASNPEWGRQAARDRLGVEALEIDGGHSPLLSRPAELAQLLDQIVRGA